MSWHAKQYEANDDFSILLMFIFKFVSLSTACLFLRLHLISSPPLEIHGKNVYLNHFSCTSSDEVKWRSDMSKSLASPWEKFTMKNRLLPKTHTHTHEDQTNPYNSCFVHITCVFPPKKQTHGGELYRSDVGRKKRRKWFLLEPKISHGRGENTQIFVGSSLSAQSLCEQNNNK